MASLIIRLTLARPECIRGESVPFQIILQNAGNRPFADLLSFNTFNEVPKLVAEPAGARPNPVSAAGEELGAPPPPFPPGAHVGHPMSPLENAGKHRHGPDDDRQTTLAPGASMQENGDVLDWLGELEPGVWRLTARSPGKADMLVSDPVELRVLPASPVALSVTRTGLRGVDADLPAAWVHGSDRGSVVFYQLQNTMLPRCPRKGLRVATVRSVSGLAVASLPTAQSRVGHVFWHDGRQLMLGVVDLNGTKPPQAVAAQAPFPGSVLSSPLSMSDGSVFVPMTDADRKRVSVVHMQAAGSGKAYPIELGRGLPLGPYSCCWEYAEKLHFVWVAASGREVFHAPMVLADPDAGAPARSIWVADHPLLSIDAYLETKAGPADQPMFQHNTPEGQRPAVPAGPRLMLWGVGASRDAIVCTRVNVQDNRARVEALFKTDRAAGMRVVGSAVTAESQLSLLLADEAGALYHAATASGQMRPLTDAAGRRIALDQEPGLMAAGETAVMPWVHVRYMDKAQGRILFAKLEPEGEKEPAHAH